MILVFLRLHALGHVWEVSLLSLPAASPLFLVLTGFFLKTGGHSGNGGNGGTVSIGAAARGSFASSWTEV